MFILKIILPIKNLNTLLYSIKKIKKKKIGCRVLIPLKKKKIIGIIKSIHKKNIYNKKFKIKKIIKIIDNKPLFTKNLWKMLHIASKYYYYPLGKILISILPKIQKKNIYIKKYIKKNKKKLININKKKYLKTINKINKKKFKIWLLILNYKENINIYVYFIKKYISKKNQILILTPKLKYIHKIKKYIDKHININSKIITSKIKKKYLIWKLIKKKHINLVIGTRSSIFMPFKKLKLIIIDNEHSELYKENKGWLYNAKKLALIRAKIENIPIILSSSTPSLNSLYKAKIKKYKILKIKKKKKNINYKIINNINNKYPINNYILYKIEKKIKKNKKILIYNNQKGYSFIICNNCKSILKCNFCKKKYIFYKKKNKLKCISCKIKKKYIHFCIKCKKKLSTIGLGIEKIEENIKKFFPKKYIKIIKKYKKNNKNIIISNDKILKFKKIKNLNLIIFLNIDYIFFSKNYRSIEKFIIKYTLLINKINLLNKKKKYIIIQTNYPNHYIWNNLINNNYEKNMYNLIKERKIINYPPYINEYSILIINKNINYIYNIYKIIKKYIKKKKIKIKIFKPIIIKKYINNNNKLKILLQSKHHYLIIKLIKKIKKKIPNSINWKLDINNI